MWQRASESLLIRANRHTKVKTRSPSTGWRFNPPSIFMCTYICFEESSRLFFQLHSLREQFKDFHPHIPSSTVHCQPGKPPAALEEPTVPAGAAPAVCSHRTPSKDYFSSLSVLFSTLPTAFGALMFGLQYSPIKNMIVHISVEYKCWRTVGPAQSPVGPIPAA